VKIDTVKIGRINAAPYNPRIDLKPSDPEYQAIARSLDDFGLVEPLVWNKRTGHLVGGHQRFKILKAKGNKALTVSIVDLPIAEERILNVTLNKASGRWSYPTLKELLTKIADGGDATRTGFTADEIAEMLNSASDKGKNEDHAPEPPRRPVSKAGDIWELGEHRLCVGDATDKKNWRALGLDAHPASMIFTDPPYGVSYKAKSGKFAVIEGDDARGDELLNKVLLPAFKLAVKHALPAAAWYVWHASSTREDFAEALRAAGLVERQYIIWAKSGIVLGHSDYRWAHEPCFYASRQESKPAYYGDRGEPTVWRASIAQGKAEATIVGTGLILQDGKGGTLWITAKPPKSKKARRIRLSNGKAAYVQQDDRASTVWQVGKERDYKHPTQKPVELAERAIRNSSRTGEVVLDMFLGSGTTLIGSEKAGRRCYGFELDPRYADVIVERWQAYAGKKATRRKA